MSEVDEIRARLATAGYPTTPSQSADEYTIGGTEQAVTPILVLNEAGLSAYLDGLESEAVSAFGKDTDPRSGARSLVELNITEALEARATQRIGVTAAGWVEVAAASPSDPVQRPGEPEDLEWSAELPQ